MNLLKNLLILVISLSVISCSSDEEREVKNTDNNKVAAPEPKKEEKKKELLKEDEYEETKVDLGLSKEDQNLLMLSETFPMGTHFKSIHSKMPEFKGIRPEGGSDDLAAQGLTESKNKVTFLGKPADLEFNFKNDSLYSYYFTITETDFNKSEKLYRGIKQFYNKKIGQGKEIGAEEETRDKKTCVWTEKSSYGILTYNLNTGLISWGFQNSKPDDINF
ncbi:MAG: hypothetical protein K2X86_07275 [Cytophagaceae bacterium]|nr:hypothetical protein [Cytophagaceae bacterium]